MCYTRCRIKKALYVRKRALYVRKRALYVRKRALYVRKRALYVRKRALHVRKRDLYMTPTCRARQQDVLNPVSDQTSPTCAQKSPKHSHKRPIYLQKSPTCKIGLLHPVSNQNSLSCLQKSLVQLQKSHDRWPYRPTSPTMYYAAFSRDDAHHSNTIKHTATHCCPRPLAISPNESYISAQVPHTSQIYVGLCCGNRTLHIRVRAQYIPQRASGSYRPTSPIYLHKSPTYLQQNPTYPHRTQKNSE